MPELFEVCWQRMRRAHAHRRALAASWNAFLTEDTYTTSIEVDADGNGVVHAIQTVPIPADISLELGELLYQYRAALDACVYELACANDARRPPAKEELLEFPICASAKAFHASLRKVASLTEEQRHVIEQAQPYHVPPTLSRSHLPYSRQRALGILNDWARKDRHRRLHVVGSWAILHVPTFELPTSAALADVECHDSMFISELPTEVLRFRVDGWEPTMTIGCAPPMSVEIALNEPPYPCHFADTFDWRLQVIHFACYDVIRALARTVGADSEDWNRWRLPAG